MPVDPSVTEPRPVSLDSIEVLEERLVRVTWYGGAVECYGLAGADVAYRPKVIEVTVHEGRLPKVDVCPEYALLKATTVELDEPVGGRRVVDGSATA